MPAPAQIRRPKPLMISSLRNRGQASLRAGRLLGLGVPALARKFLSGRPAAEAWFEHYASVFDTVEINNSFYRFRKNDVRALGGASARGFLFAVKASRFLTHMKKLKDPEKPLDRLRPRPARRAPRSGAVSAAARLETDRPGWSTSCRHCREAAVT